MKRSTWMVGVMAALAALMAVPAMAVEPMASDTTDVNLSIDPYCQISWDGTSFDILLTGGGETASDTENYTAKANFSAQITGDLAMDEGIPGNWSCTIDAAAPPALFGPGIHSGAVTVTVEDIDLTVDADDWNGQLVGTMTRTLSHA